MMMGRWLNILTSGTAEISRLLRISFSKVRMPRSHTKMGKGVTISADEIILLRDLLNEIDL